MRTCLLVAWPDLRTPGVKGGRVMTEGILYYGEVGLGRERKE